ncbi:MAG: phosphotransferase [Mycobacterium sp.]|nr:phosphotransferase [Mycobacterium sp.]
MAREPVLGGQRSAAKEKLRIVESDRELTVLLKWTSPAEVVALRAASSVPRTTAIPRLIQSGRDSRGDWIAVPFYTGEPARTETTIPDNVMDSLAAVHAHYLNSAPLGAIPVRDGTWWKARCAQPRLRQLGRPSLQPIIEVVQSWSSHRLIVEALTELPRTLLHGDVHRNNVVVSNHTGRLIDWGGAAYRLPQLDVITPGPLGSRGFERYASAWQALTGESTAGASWQRGYLAATVCNKVDYLGFVARNFGDDAARARFETAARALSELERSDGQ